MEREKKTEAEAEKETETKEELSVLARIYLTIPGRQTLLGLTVGLHGDRDRQTEITQCSGSDRSYYTK